MKKLKILGYSLSTFATLVAALIVTFAFVRLVVYGLIDILSMIGIEKYTTQLLMIIIVFSGLLVLMGVSIKQLVKEVLT